MFVDMFIYAPQYSDDSRRHTGDALTILAWHHKVKG